MYDPVYLDQCTIEDKRSAPFEPAQPGFEIVEVDDARAEIRMNAEGSKERDCAVKCTRGASGFRTRLLSQLSHTRSKVNLKLIVRLMGLLCQINCP